MPPEPEPGELPERKKFGKPIIVAVLMVAIAVVVVLVLGGGEDKNSSSTEATTTPAVTSPTATTLSPTTGTATTAAPKPTSPGPGVAPSKAPPTAKPAATVTNCDPILGNGQPYPVTSSSTTGTPTECTEARSVLIEALNTQATQIGAWSCTVDLSGPKPAVCKSGDKTLVAKAPPV